MSVKECFSEIGYLVITAKNGRKAIEIVDRIGERICILITDISMPMLDGISLIHHIRRIYTELPIFVITGYDKEDVLDLIAELNVVSIYKPLDLNTLENQLVKLWQAS